MLVPPEPMYTRRCSAGCWHQACAPTKHHLGNSPHSSTGHCNYDEGRWEHHNQHEGTYGTFDTRRLEWQRQ